MDKPYRKKAGSEDRRPKRRDDAGDEKKPVGYKAKRSFTKNKEFRKDAPVKKFGDKAYKPYTKDISVEKNFGDKPKRSFSENKSEDKRPARKFSGEDKRAFSKAGEDFKPRKFDGKYDSKKEFDKPAAKKYGVKKEGFGEERSRRVYNSDEKRELKRPFKRSFDKPGEKLYDKPIEKPARKSEAKSFDKPFNNSSPYKKTFGKTFKADDKAANRSYNSDGKPRRKSKPRGQEESEPVKRFGFDEFQDGKTMGVSSNPKTAPSKYKKNESARKPAGDGLTRLNKYLSNAGIASRRDADTLIKSGVVKVNGVPITEMGFKVKPGDVVNYGDEKIKGERKVYLLLNKPKDYITTTEDPQERKTVMELINGACKERLYPVGRLDRNTTGLLLFTNDGELTTKLTHPKHNIKKVYHVSLNKGLKTEDFKQISEGVELEDGIVKADDVAYVADGKKEIGIEIHSGKNRIVRRIFEHLGYEVLKLDRVVFAGLTKKDLPRGKHRFLTGKEISFLQMVG
jgi:23S rRNA pseudouridine2605 synthase